MVALLLRRARWVALVAAALLVASALGLALTHRHYDVDELQHAHVSWRVAMGDRPFHDFVESHPPFVWYLASPLMRAVTDPVVALSLLRCLAAAFGLGFAGLVCACAWTGLRELRIEWLLAGLLVVLSNARNMDFLIEARPDSLANCLLFLAFLLFLHARPAPLLARYALFAFLASTAILWNPKFALLVAVFGVLDLFFYRRDALVPALAGHALGIGLAIALALAGLAAAGIDPVLAYQLSIGFHQQFLSSTSFWWGLFNGVRSQPVQMIIVGVGFWAWQRLARRHGMPARPFEIAAAFFLLVTLFTVPLPYKQYFAPWFVLSIVFVPYIGVLLRDAPKAVSEAILLTVLVVAGLGAFSAATQYSSHDQRSLQHQLWNVMLGATDADARVVVAPGMHPVYRRDVFYAWFSTWDPGGRDQEAIMGDWDPMGYGERFRREGYLADLARHPPDLILKTSRGLQLPVTQQAVVSEYLEEHADDYLNVPIAGGAYALIRRDRANRKFLGRMGHRPGKP